MSERVPDVEIGPATQADGTAVVALWRAAGLTRPWNDPDRDFADALVTATSTVLVARGPGGIDGTAAGDDPAVVGSVMAGFDGHRGWLYYLAVAPEARGQGLGRELVVAAEAWLAGQGAPKVQLMVRRENADVQAFYAALGYEDADCVVLGRRF
ncbi:GNAT family acetyltransferase [Flavimobilis marinus]|uniref:Ribosomal protein S18 acetylase RimI n=1 Tax=Flavimobilis marinus TaxID=285351 RepID=A0A1I2DAV7_9MICO|nr:GNAT family acetyltransferase [Flavimobilis marinus]GHG45622.1 GNAT family acetyltransferase [Flavimobilis marinus]SFE77619.1 Ribosomal protein S18 acetylase RimI [Flavimobilis marinus]